LYKPEAVIKTNILLFALVGVIDAVTFVQSTNDVLDVEVSVAVAALTTCNTEPVGNAALGID
jgi:hypothetical protein